ncbi:hypothetical protein BABINDRAFT_179873 [Babjeviella inositovora NRRL Y-12698]|uniref:OBG-type G domain-containing protein n=1 Tax=Babjeviella inositovora NRRL Y-12698 TaxID=984486 RepID=A0A1E3QS34_9ASCO|nr:uncharacterized protein BABINDRAFT_179873 [Babjeviella inositovora NRRL Y-12698]ODQ80513.1 hypothetical protein BABINDRAFT_179873 [Babjeviella inositovora NRRL Y-12698]
MGILEKIEQIKLELSRTQKNKATEYHIGLLKGKLARYRRQLLEPAAGSGGSTGQGFEVQKSGDARVVLIGFPSVGKSSFLSKITKTKSEVANYAFTTLTSVPGVLEYHGAEIQVVDLPGIIRGASQGKGRGRQVVATAKTAELILMVLDATKSNDQREILEAELESVGIRLNCSKPNIHFRVKKTGGIKFNSTSPPTYLSEKICYAILKDYKIHNADILVRDPECTVDDFIDIINEDHITYVKCLYVYNKVDAVSLEETDRLAREPQTCVMSCELDLGITDLVEAIWKNLNLTRLYTKRRGILPKLDDPMVVRHDSSIEKVCDSIHKDFKNGFKYALVWGSSAKHSPQKCGLSHIVHDEDVVQLVIK